VNTFEKKQENTLWGCTLGSSRCECDYDIVVSRLASLDIVADVNVAMLNGYCRSNAGSSLVRQGTNGASTFVHELGHSFSLADEYVEDSKCDPDNLHNRQYGRPNVDVEPLLEKSKWAHWNGYPGIGVYEGALYCTKGAYRPFRTGRMQSGHGQVQWDFEGPHREGILLSMMERSQVIIHHSPEIAEQSCERANGMEGATCKMWIEEGLVRYHCGSTDWMGEWWIQEYCYAYCFCQGASETRMQFSEGDAQVFSIDHTQNTEDSVQMVWKLNGKEVGHGSSWTLVASDNAPGRYELEAIVHDGTTMVRKDDEHVMTETRTWVLEVIDPNLESTEDVDCVLPESQDGYVMGKWAKVKECTTNFCTGPVVSYVDCADGYTGEVSVFGCSVYNTEVVLKGCIVKGQPSTSPTTKPSVDILGDFFITEYGGECPPGSEIMDEKVCEMAAYHPEVDLEWKPTRVNYYAIEHHGCMLMNNDGKKYVQMNVEDGAWYGYLVYQKHKFICYDNGATHHPTHLPSIHPSPAPTVSRVSGECWYGQPAADDEFSFYQDGWTWTVTNSMVKQGSYVLGYGDFESGSYSHGDYCWVTRKGRTANVNFDSSPHCTNSAREPSTCHYDLNVCACTEEDDGRECWNGQPADDDEFSFYQNGHTWKVTNSMVKQGSYVLGYGDFQSGSYDNGDYCWVTRKGRTTNVKFDSSPSCTNSASEPSTCHYELNVCACTEDDGNNPMRFVKVSNGEHCPTMEQRITAESDCILAASALGLEWALSWNGVNDVPGCIFADDGRSLVYWNSAQNNRDVFNSQYAEICHQLDMEESNAATDTFTFSVTKALADVHPIVRFLAYVGVAFTIVWTISACNSMRKTQEFTRIEEAEI